MTVLVLTRPLMDATADLVITELHARGVPVHRLDPGEFPENLAITAQLGDDQEDWRGTWRGQHRDLHLEEVTAVYYRRPGPFRLHPGLSDEDARWAYDEARHGFGGVLTSLPCVWVNHPHRNAVADYAPHALAVAHTPGQYTSLVINGTGQTRTVNLPTSAAATHFYNDLITAEALEMAMHHHDVLAMSFTANNSTTVHGLVHPPTESWARITPHTTDRAADVTSSGPRDLWNERLSLITQWYTAGRPTPGAHRLTVQTHGQHTLWREEPTPTSWAL